MHAPVNAFVTRQQAVTGNEPTGVAMAAYVLLLIPFPLFPLIGFIITLVNLSSKPDWLATHFRWQVRTVLIGLLFGLIGAVTAFIFVGILILIATWVWSIVRHIKGISALNRREPIANIETWGW